MSKRGAERLTVFVVAILIAMLAAGHISARAGDVEALEHSIVVRTTENVTEGGWVWLLNQAKAAGVSRIELLVKQDENGFVSRRTGETLASGELLVALPGEVTARGWENSEWLVEFLARAKEDGIEVWAWWPTFQDARVGETYPESVSRGPDGSVFTDPGFEAVRARQEELIAKLLATYSFDGVALDWLRYNARDNGSAGPVAKKFAEITGASWSEERMANALDRAIWDDLRARQVADWVASLTERLRPANPRVGWSAFVLPWQFKEVSQSYRRLATAGLDELQPMIYWRDWSEDPDWTKEVLARAPFWLTGSTSFNPAFDLNNSEDDILAAISTLPVDRIGGITWYLHGNWGGEHFALLRRVAEARKGLANKEVDGAWPPAFVPLRGRLEPAVFPSDAAVWAVVCLAELYKRDALSDLDPVVPTLAFHRFAEGERETGETVWHTSTEYLDELLAFIDAGGFSVIPVSTLEAYMISEDPTVLPPRPLAITIDDGSATILSLFHSRALARGFPYAVSLVTGWLSDAGKELDTGDGSVDRILTWAEADALAASESVTFVSHSTNLHEYRPSGPDGLESGPAVTTRLWLPDQLRRETEGERLRRVNRDLRDFVQPFYVWVPLRPTC